MSDGLNILVYANGPCVPTGFGTVVRNIFAGLVARGRVPIADLNFFGINYAGDPHGLPFKIWPAQIAASRDPDLFGRARFVQLLLGNQWPCDVLFLLEDHFTLSQPIPANGGFAPFIPGLIRGMREQVRQGRPPFKVVQYIPVDGRYLRPEWVNWISDLVDFPVAYTKFGAHTLIDYDATLAPSLRDIPHGTNPEMFFPVSSEQREAFRQQQLGLDSNAKLVVNVNRNQPRKDIPKTLQVFRRVLDQMPEARLYLHMNTRDSAGFDLGEVMHQLRLPKHAVLFPQNFSEGIGIPVEALNLVYNAADIYITTARGEGWGLPVSEHMTTGGVCVAPDHSSYSEILADGRGVLIPPTMTPDIQPSDNDQFRPSADVPAMAEAVLALLNDEPRRKAIGEKARAWALQHSWAHHIVPRWEDIFLECHRQLKQPQPRPQPRYTLNGLSLGV